MLNRRWWDVAAIAVASILVLFTLFDPPPYGPNDWGVWATTGAFLVFYFAYARAHLGADRLTPHLVISIAFAVLLGVGAAFEPSFAILQVFIYPFIWTTAPSIRSALLSNVLIGVALAAGYIVHFGPSGIVAGLISAAVSVGFSIALGLWITNIALYGQERGRLLEELQAAQGQLAAMHRDAGVVEERARLAREIHDTIAQSLTGLVMVAQRTGTRLDGVDGEAGASARADVELMEQMAREALTEARGLVASLAPVEPGAGLADALDRLAATFERETGVVVTVSASATGLSREHEVVLLRSAQEGLANVRKHASARHAAVTIESIGGEVVLTVADDGVGPGAAAPGASGFGLSGIRDRTALVGGSFAIEPGAHGGTVLRVGIPRADAATDPSPTTTTEETDV
ncbi:sensor histidine kinase [Agromyces cerinus]|uniref:Signal transduction histidine kinase n=1 Tax=Agromyces cerinus subsp. cerinus TaxID=232089 RepID=A0A1N6GS35_9MICO|nr:sensor histidine kinase [Agromyces cerinus]SIO10165.1 Signal transduction histidine kinase [Agromyces cerinus subsp. cerinus]